MATTKPKGPNKSEFIRQLLGRDPETNLKAVNAAWKKAGHTGSISNPLFYQNKPKTQGTSTKGSANGATTSKATPKKPKVRATKKRGEEKSVFVRELLGRNPEANLRAVNEAWSKAGNKGTISSTLVYLIKSKSYATSKAAPQKSTAEHVRPATPPASRRNASSVAHGGMLDELEGEIDDLMFKLKGLGGLMEVEEALRQARRLIVRHQG